MTLFDKLKEIVTGQKVNTPLLDETVKKYYEILYWMGYNMDWRLPKGKDDIVRSAARRYFELVTGEPCDEETFLKTVELLNIGRGYSKDKLVIEVQALRDNIDSEISKVIHAPSKKEAISLSKYYCEPEKAYRVCFKELVSEIKSDYESILDVIRDNVECKHFIEGFNKHIFEKYVEKYKEVSGIRNHIDMCAYIAISDSFFEENPVTKELLFNFFIDILHNRINNDWPKEKTSVGSFLYSLASHAIHFENHGQGEYAPIEYDECKKLVSNWSSYVKIIEDHPFEKEEYINRFAEEIRTAYSFSSATQFSSFVEYDHYYWNNHTALNWAKRSGPLFSDALANFVWKKIAKEYIETIDENGVVVGESKDPEVVINMIYHYNKED